MRFLKSIILSLFLMVSSLPLFAQAIPVSIQNARRNAPEDVLVGIGMAKAGTDWDSMSLAEIRARVELAMALSSTVSRSSVYIRNSWIAELVKETDGTWWCALYLGRDDIAASVFAQEIPVAILSAIRNKPGDRLIGIGMAKAESEWESMSLAMTRARLQIARALSTEVYSRLTDYTLENDLFAYQEEADVLSSAHLKGTRIVALTKAPDGVWWSAIYMPRNLVTVTPQQIDYSDIFLYDLSRVSSISNPRVVPDIILWINHVSQRVPEEMVYGFGVAKLETDTASFQLAKERAINSIAHSLHAEISSTVTYYSYYSEIDPDSYIEQFSESISVKSEYENTDLPLGLVDFVKTEDGSLWVAVGCKAISEARLGIPAMAASEAEARMEEAFRRAAREAG